MLLPQTAEYALRAMAFLATLDPGTGIRAKDLSDKTGIPAHYLSKILRRLVLSDLLVSQKGHGGGFQLARAPEDIAFREVLAAADYTPTAKRCAFGWGQCDAKNPCPLHPVWSKLNEAYEEWAQTMTLENVGEWIPLTERKRRPKAAKKKRKRSARG